MMAGHMLFYLHFIRELSFGIMPTLALFVKGGLSTIVVKKRTGFTKA